jgi:hypothetical protein
VHYGVVDDVKVMPMENSMGTKTQGGLHVPDVITQHAPSQILEAMNAQKEEIYFSNRREPLGKGYSRGHVLPEKVTDGDFRFGVKSEASEDARLLVYPEEFANSIRTAQEAAHPLYVASHGNYEPGEQRRRGYEWEKTTIQDPAAFRFGKTEKEEYINGVGKALNPAIDETLPHNPGVASKKVEDFKDTHTDELGKPRNLGLGARGLGIDHAFGMPARGANKGEWDAARCIHGAMSEKEQAPDFDLGRSVKPGLRNISGPHIAGDPNRRFGCPSIRKDISAPRIKSVADIQNYGDEPDAKMLLYPSGFTDVNDDDFLQPYSEKEMKEIMDGAGIDYGDEGNFKALYAEAEAKCDALNIVGGVPIEIFRRLLLGIPI